MNNEKSNGSTSQENSNGRGGMTPTQDALISGIVIGALFTLVVFSWITDFSLLLSRQNPRIFVFIVEWLVSFIVLAWISYFFSTESVRVFNKIKEISEYRAAFSVFVILGLVFVAFIFIFSSQLLEFVRQLGSFGFLFSYSVGVVILFSERIPVFGVFLFVFCLVSSAGIAFFGRVFAGSQEIVVFVAFLLGVLTYQAVRNVIAGHRTQGSS